MRSRALAIGFRVALGALAIAWPKSIGAAPRLDAAFVELFAGTRRHPLADPSGRLPLAIELPPFADARRLGFQPLAQGLATVRLFPDEIAAFEASHPDLRFSVWPALRPVLDESAKLNGTLAYRAALAASGATVTGTGKGVVVGIVDSGLDVTHPDFLDAAGHTRVAWLIDFSHKPIGRHADLENTFGCTDPMQTPCAVLDAADIDEVLAGTSALDRPRDWLGHGTHVASIAAGNGGGPSGRFVGGAPEATLVIADVAQGAAGESSDVDIASGIGFVFDRAAALGMPAVANLSLGSDFGPHDGTTPLEKALGDMIGPLRPGRAIVAAAGNSGALYQSGRAGERLGIHTQMRVTEDVPARLPIRSLTSSSAEKVSGVVKLWLTYGAREHVAVGLDGPEGLFIAAVPAGAKAAGNTSDNAIRAGIYNGVVDPDVSLTADTHGAIIIVQGAWPTDAEMALRFTGEGVVDAWIETSPDSINFGEFFEVGIREGTVGVPATAPDLIAVGCTVNRTTWTDEDAHDHDVNRGDTLHSIDFSLLGEVDETCYFSSAGPTATGETKPEISAPGGLVVAAMSSDAVPNMGQESIFDAPPGACPDGNACLVVDAMHAILSGSSMAAPQVTGAVALLFERDPSLTQSDVRMLLEQGARRPSGTVGADYQLGVGALGVTGAVAALDARATSITREPDASQSWMSLSAGYARPDVDRPVAGAVEVRASDGSLADGFDPARLSLAVSPEGIVTKPLARVAAGLYRFEVRGVPDTGSRAIDIDVRLDGVTIGERASRLSGHRTLPIGADRFIALGTSHAYGGCTLSPSPPPRPPLGLLGLVAFAYWRMRKTGRREGGESRGRWVFRKTKKTSSPLPASPPPC